MPEFHETKMGHIFYEVTMPDIAKSLKEISRLLMVIGCQDEEKEKKNEPFVVRMWHECTYCGYEVEDTQDFCPECKRRVIKT